MATVTAHAVRERKASTRTLLSEVRPNVKRGQFKWPGYVFPTSMVRAVMETVVRPAMLGQMPEQFNEDENFGWLEQLAQRGSVIVGNSIAVQRRRIYDVMHETSRVTHTENVDGWLLAAGLRIDQDTSLPTLPGNKTLALELLHIRAEALDPGVTERDVIHLVAPLLLTCQSIVDSPELLSELQDEAPFDCLRPWGGQL